ncbi:hypothetical protein D9758_012534 [Tetrapyrgos nigripes]|uniref:Uncharacterized protein n=1 Tax=Tetrapyrgos nigripes TaxID=182062 RepID=A0A8H5LHP1_9AGAR|nr:hypothetical protein D9758_012534 [Tetrapyrgos nigripes]
MALFTSQSTTPQALRSTNHHGIPKVPQPRPSWTTSNRNITELNEETGDEVVECHSAISAVLGN